MITKEKLLNINWDLADRIISDQSKWVREIKIPKKRGGFRKIVEPVGEYKTILKSISFFLLKYNTHDAAHGFKINRSIVTNAKPHLRSRSLGTIDVKDFFDSINEDHLKNCLLGNKKVCKACTMHSSMKAGKCSPSLYKNQSGEYIGVCPEIKAMLIPDFCEKSDYDPFLSKIVNLVTYKGYTPQGFPTSPILANIIMRGFDDRVAKWCKEREINYTRYADDLSFSHGGVTDENEVYGMSSSELANIVVPKAKSMLWAYGFEVNPKKVRFRHRGARLEVCGVVVNDKLSVSKYQMKMFRAMVHHAVVKHPEKLTVERLMKLRGWCSYLMSIDKVKGKKYMDMLATAKPGLKNVNMEDTYAEEADYGWFSQGRDKLS